MLTLGIDLGTSSVKVSVLDTSSGECIASAHYPEKESEIISRQPGWAEQEPSGWWNDCVMAIQKCHVTKKYDPQSIDAIGIAYQMHGLVLVDKQQQVLRPSIIWCDSRAVEIGSIAFNEIGQEKCLSRLLNSPGNFTASKLAWVKQHEPSIYGQVDKLMLPGDYIALQLTGENTTTHSALSEGIFWDFQSNSLSVDVLAYYGFDPSFFPALRPLFGPHGQLKKDIAEKLNLRLGIPVSYKAGDQPNNALSLNVLQPGDVAATAGTSGVIYAVSDELGYDSQSRVNSFAHVNHPAEQKSGNDHRIGVLLCINGAGSFYRWVKSIVGGNYSYEELNNMAKTVAPGAEGLTALPFGNGAERMLNNEIVGAHFHHLDLNVHTTAHLARAAQEGIAFAFRYGLDIMRENGNHPRVIRAARTNLFLSDVFTQTFANVNNIVIEFYDGDGSIGAALGAAIGAGAYSIDDIMKIRKPVGAVSPTNTGKYNELYEQWLDRLDDQMERQSPYPVTYSQS